jgi:hypothetical protein
LSHGIETTQIVVGFTYNSDGQMVRPIAMADTGARNGPGLGKTRRTQRYAALVSNTLGISFGTEIHRAVSRAFRKANGNADRRADHVLRRAQRHAEGRLQL